MPNESLSVFLSSAGAYDTYARPVFYLTVLLLLAIPATLLAAELLARPIDQAPTRSEKWLKRLWIALYAWMLINPGMTSLTHVNVSVLLLTATAVLMTRRATRPAAQVAIEQPKPILVEARRAA